MKFYFPKNTTLWLITASLLITACTKPAENPQQVAEKYWQLIQSGNTKAAKLLVSSQSRPTFDADMKQLKPVKSFILKGSRTSVTTVLNPSANNPASNRSFTFNTILVLEHGQWKVDTSQTHIPAAPDTASQQKLTNDISRSIHDNLNTMNSEMNKGIKLLNEALQEGSKDMSDSFVKGMKQLNESMKKSIEKLKRRRQQDNPQPIAPAIPDRNKGEGVI